MELITSVYWRILDLSPSSSTSQEAKRLHRAQPRKPDSELLRAYFRAVAEACSPGFGPAAATATTSSRADLPQAREVFRAGIRNSPTGCFCKLGVLIVGVLITRAFIWHLHFPDFWKLAIRCRIWPVCKSVYMI